METNLRKKNQSASRLGKKTALQKFLEEQTKKMPRWDGSRFVDSSNKNILQLNPSRKFDSQRKKKSRVKARLEEMDAELDNYKHFKKNIEIESSRQKESETWADDSKASIKLMLVNNYMQDDESGSDQDNQQILKDLDGEGAFKKKEQVQPQEMGSPEKNENEHFPKEMDPSPE